MKQLFTILALLMACSTSLMAQQRPSEEEQEKQLLEYIDKEVERLTSVLKLEYWQTFYADSTMVHDFQAMREEMKALSDSKVSNQDMYIAVQDKWNEKIYESFRRFLTDEQWAKYEKTGAGREKRARDKRKAKAEKK